MKSSKILRKIIAGSMAVAMVAGTGVSTSLGAIIGTNISVSAADTLSEGDFEYQINDSGTVTITKYTGESKNVVIPEKIGNIAVEAIGSQVFYQSTITSVSFPKTLKEIGYRSFFGCKSLKDVSFPEGLTKIGEAAFEDCYSFTNVNLPSSVEEIGSYVFKNCVNLTSVNISPKIKVIPNSAFCGTYISTVDIPDSVTTMGEYAFFRCRNLKTVSFGSEPLIKNIGYEAFYECTSLESFTVPDSVEFIDNYSFEGCTSLKNIKIGSSVKSIRFCAFRYCSALQNITIPDNVETIDSNCFYGCISLSWVKFGKGIKRISSNMFSNCTELNSVWLGSSIERIDSCAFDNCLNLKYFYTIPSKNITLEHNAILSTKWYSQKANGPVYFGKVLYNYKGKMSNSTTLKIAEGTVKINSNAFRENTNLTSVTIPASLTDINFTDIFDSSTSLKSITIAEGNEKYKSIDGVVYSADGQTLIYCPRGKTGTLTIPDEVVSVGSYSVRDCSKITTVELGLNVRNIDQQDFSKMPSLTSISVPSDNTYFSSQNGILYNKNKTYLYAYPNAKSGVYTIPESLSDMYYYVFQNVKGITEINVPAGLNNFRYGFLYSCPTLKAINVDENNTSYSSIDGVLYNKAQTVIQMVPNAKSGALVIADTTTNVESANTFANCTALTTVTIPAATLNVGDGYFDNCLSITKFIVSDENTKFSSENGLLMNKDKTFIYAIPKKMTEVTIPSTIKSYAYIREAALNNCPNMTVINLHKDFDNFSNYQRLDNCPKLITINVDADNSTYASVDGIVYNKAKTTLVYVPNGKSGSFTIPSSVTAINNESFKGAEKLTSVTFQSSFAGTLDNAYIFRNCHSLTSINYNSSNKNYTTVNGVVFNKNKTELYYVPNAKNGTYTVPSTVTNINDRAFLNCSKLTNIILPEGLKKVSFDTTGLSNLTEIKIPASVDSLSNRLYDIPDIVISGYEGTEAETYANVNDISFNKLANSITLNKTSTETAVGRTVKLSVTFDTTRTSDKTITWRSENANIAKVASDGTVTAVSPGIVKISATTADGKTVYCNLTVNPVLENTSSISANEILLGDTVTLNASSNGGVRSFKYAMLYKLSSDSDWTTINNFKSDTTTKFTPDKVGTYDVCIKVKDSDSVIESKYFTVKVNNAVSNTSTVSENLLTIGEVLIINGNSTGGIGKSVYQYEYKLSSDSDWTTITAYSSRANATVFKPSKKGTYNIRVTAKDENDNTAQKIFDITVTGILANTSTISADKIVLGDSVTIKGSSTGGKGDYTYAYYYKKFTNNNWTKIADYSINKTAKATPKEFGDYQICVKVKDKNGTVVSKYMNVIVNDKLKNNSEISAETITLGSTFTAKAVAADGMSGYTYAFYYKKASETKWTVKQDFGTKSSVSIQPAYATKYDVCIKVKDKAGNIEKKYFTVDIKAPLKNNSTISAETINLGSTFTAKAVAADGMGGYTYAFYYKKASETKWTVKQDFGTKSSVSIQPAYATKYDVCVKVKDKAGNIEKKYFTVDVKAPLKNNSTISAETINLGSTFTAKAVVSGGMGGYTYAFYYKKASETKWTVKQDFGTKSSVSIQPAYATKYDVCIKVKDKAGNIEKKYFTVDVKAPLKNNSTISAETINLGSTFTAKAVASGGMGEYTYAFYYKKASETKWTVKQDFGTKSSVSIQPAYATKYDVCIKVKDKAGNIEKKYFTVTVK